MDNNIKQPAKRRSKFAGKEDVSRETAGSIMTGQIDQLRDISRLSDQVATKIQESVDILYNKRISVDVKEFEQLKREFTYEMQQQAKKVKQPSKGLKWYIFMWAITLISAFLAGYFIHESRKWKQDATYWYRQYEGIKK